MLLSSKIISNFTLTLLHDEILNTGIKITTLSHRGEYSAFSRHNPPTRKVYTLKSRDAIVENKGAKFKFHTKDVIKKWKKEFVKADLSEPKLSIENIIASILQTRQISDIYKKKNSFLSREQIKKVIKMCRMRLESMPIQYVIREWDFRNLTLEMRPPVFIPRPETEQLVDLVLTELNTNPIEEVLELCCGSGAISIALLKENPDITVIAVDKSEEACSLTRDNAKRYGIDSRINIIQMDINEISPEYFDKKFDVIVSNPPYVPSGDMLHLQPEILGYEDRDALDGGSDGLVLIKLILQKSSYLLRPGGKTFLEVDPSHPQLLDRLLEENNRLRLSIGGVHKDIFERDRFVIIKKML